MAFIVFGPAIDRGGAEFILAYAWHIFRASDDGYLSFFTCTVDDTCTFSIRFFHLRKHQRSRVSTITLWSFAAEGDVGGNQDSRRSIENE